MSVQIFIYQLQDELYDDEMKMIMNFPIIIGDQNEIYKKLIPYSNEPTSLETIKEPYFVINNPPTQYYYSIFLIAQNMEFLLQYQSSMINGNQLFSQYLDKRKKQIQEHHEQHDGLEDRDMR